MPNIRIKDIPTTASQSSSSDFLAIDGSSGTRKLSAYSPTFGGNLTVSGTATASGQVRGGTLRSDGTITMAGTNSRIVAGPTSWGVTNNAGTVDNLAITDAGAATIAGTLTVQGAAASNFASRVDVNRSANTSDPYTHIGLTRGSGAGNTSAIVTTGDGANGVASTSIQIAEVDRLKVTTTATTLAGNLIVSGTGASTFSGNVVVANTLSAKDTNAALTLQAGPGTGGINYGFGQGSGAHVWYNGTDEKMTLTSGGNLLLGTVTDTSFRAHIVSASDYQMQLDTTAGQSYTSLYLANAGTSKAFFTYGSYANKLYIGTIASGGEVAIYSGANATALTLDSSQNATFAGLVGAGGVTLSAWNLIKGVQVAGGGFFGSYSGNTYLANNWYYDGYGEKYIGNGYASRTYQSGAYHVWQYAPNNTSGAGAALTWITGMTLTGIGGLQLNQYGAGTLSTDASGNVTASSDARLKTNLRAFTRGLADVLKLAPKVYNWTEASKLDAESDYVGFVAQDVQTAVPEAVYEGKDADKMLTLNDRALLAAVVNAIKELNAKIA